MAGSDKQQTISRLRPVSCPACSPSATVPALPGAYLECTRIEWLAGRSRTRAACGSSVNCPQADRPLRIHRQFPRNAFRPRPLHFAAPVTRTARKSLTLVNVCPLTTESPQALEKPMPVVVGKGLSAPGRMLFLPFRHTPFSSVSA